MTMREPRTSPIVPSYGERSLAELSASILASLNGDADGNVLQLPPAPRACLLIVDGLGWELLRAHQAAAPFLSELAFNSTPLTCGFPATTVTSLTSLGTGLPPGQHGMLGYQVAVPGSGRLLNGLRWPDDIDPLAWQPRPTVYQRAAEAGIGAVYVAAGRLRSTGLSRTAFRAPEFRAARSLGALAAETLTALHESERIMVTAYHGQLDEAGHEYGVASRAWAFQLAHTDRLAEQIAGSLPPDTMLYITADHGMVDVAPADRVDFDATPELRDGVALLGGEARARHVYAEPGAARDVLARWREALGDQAWVASREEAVSDGWFGPVDDGMAARIGDVIAAAASGGAVVATSREPNESRLIGMHGSLTAAEQLVPLLAFASR
ncbi:MAG: alkaline phosphatase family protein [Nocardiopsaceae bacterium]|nr:alkaline phosphatase family protein [Nocardiopsaceae bacterium]